jgi:glyoxylase-like metal-dependent hydrolase (beta-lactamase superfamily II)
MLQIGDIRIHIIKDSEYLSDYGGVFGLVPRAVWERANAVELRENDLVWTVTHNLLVQAVGKTIVIDTGYGANLHEKMIANWHLTRPDGTLMDGLARLNIRPEDVDLVIDTHLHGDHCGGNIIVDEDGKIRPAFPNAEYVAQRREYEDAMQPNERTRATYVPDNYRSLVESGQMRLLDGDTDFAPGIRGVVAPGHTPGHMAVRFESNGQHAAYVCDLATFSIHFERLGWMTAYDIEPIVTLETKREWQQWALETDALLIFPHDPLRPVARLTEAENGRPRLVKHAIEYA